LCFDLVFCLCFVAILCFACVLIFFTVSLKQIYWKLCWLKKLLPVVVSSYNCFPTGLDVFILQANMLQLIRIRLKQITNNFDCWYWITVLSILFQQISNRSTLNARVERPYWTIFALAKRIAHAGKADAFVACHWCFLFRS
jgi:hypothetical protein